MGVFPFDIDGPLTPGTICGPCLTGLMDALGVPPEVRAALLDGWFAQLVTDGKWVPSDEDEDGDDVHPVQAQGEADAIVPGDGADPAPSVGVPGLRTADSPDLRGADVVDGEGA